MARISDSAGGPAGTVPLAAGAGPRSRWRIGQWEFRRYARAEHGPGSRGRWGCTWRNSRGIGNCRTPLGAYLGLRRSLLPAGTTEVSELREHLRVAQDELVRDRARGREREERPS
jgi:hypothetical protein